jgi:hypothetical protein
LAITQLAEQTAKMDNDTSNIAQVIQQQARQTVTANTMTSPVVPSDDNDIDDDTIQDLGVRNTDSNDPGGNCSIDTDCTAVTDTDENGNAVDSADIDD